MICAECISVIPHIYGFIKSLHSDIQYMFHHGNCVFHLLLFISFFGFTHWGGKSCSISVGGKEGQVAALACGFAKRRLATLPRSVPPIPRESNFLTSGMQLGQERKQPLAPLQATGRTLLRFLNMLEQGGCSTPPIQTSKWDSDRLILGFRYSNFGI